MGLIHSLVIHEANVHNSVSAKLLLLKAKNKMPRLLFVWADAGYRGMLIWYVWIVFHWFLDIVERTSKDFKVLHRILSKDYEYSPRSSEDIIYTSMLHLMLKKLG